MSKTFLSPPGIKLTRYQSKSMMEACRSPDAPEIDRLIDHSIDVDFFHINETMVEQSTGSICPSS